MLSAGAAELFARGIFPDPISLLQAQPATDDAPVRWFQRPAGDRLTGLIFSDGSGLHQKWAALRAAGWALVSCDRFGEPLAAAYGPVPRKTLPLQTARDGEDWAIRMAAYLCEPPLDFHVDCQASVSCMTLGSTPAGPDIRELMCGGRFLVYIRKFGFHSNQDQSALQHG